MNLNFYNKALNLLVSSKKSLGLSMMVLLFMGSASAQSATGLNFDGVNDYVTIPVNAALNISSAITIETWINPSKSTGTQDVLSKSSSVSNNSFIFPRTSDGWKTIEFLANINGYGWKVLKVTYGQAKLNQWHHVAATYDGLKMKIIIDGVQAGEFSFAGSITVNNNALSLGNQVGFSEYFGGTLDETKIWNRALTACEISNNLTCELNIGIQTGLVAYYQFNQGLINVLNTGLTTLTDASTTGANGTLVNFGLVGLLSNWAAGSAVNATSCPAYVPPVISAGAAQTTVPLGGTISLFATSSVAGSTYSWAGPNGFTSTLQNPVLTGVSALTSGTYTVTITANGCSLTASTVITIASSASGLNFDGVDDNILVPYSPSNTFKTFTIEAWINPSANITPVQSVVSTSSRLQDNGFQFPKTYDGWNSFSFDLSINNVWKTVTANFPVSALGQWNHVAATFDGYFMKIYLNGAQVGILEVNGTYTDNTNDITIGNRDGLSQFYKGSLDELRIWSRAQSQCEIINNMQTCELNGDYDFVTNQNGLAKQIGLASYYRMNQGLVGVDNSTINFLSDSSGNANNGTLRNFALNGTTSNWINGKVNGLCAYFPPALLSASANGTAFEVGSTVKLFANNGNNNTYNWDGPNTYTSSNQNPVIASIQPIQAGTYTVSTPYTGCVVTASTRVNITTASQIVPNGPTNICPSSSVTLSTATAGISYQWYQNDVAITGATSNQYIATQTGIYTVSIINGTAVTISAGLQVTVVPDVTPPVADVASLPAISINVGSTVTAIPTATDNCRGSINGTPNTSLTFNTPGTYTIIWTYDDLNGNKTVQSQQLTVIDNIAPVLTLPSNVSVQATAGICGAVANFIATATDNSGGLVTINYSSNPGTQFSLGMTTVTVTATDPSNNSISGSFTVTVLPAPVAPITGNTTICMGSTTTLSSATIGGTWSSDNLAVASIDALGVVTAQSVGTANITYTDVCGTFVTAIVTIVALPSTPNISVADNCGSSILTTNATGTLLWNTNETTPSITVTSGGNFTVTQTINGCTSNQATAIASPLALPTNPVVTVVNNCGSSTLSTNATGTLVWNTGETTPSIIVSNAGTYTVTQTINGCTSVAGSGIAAPNSTPPAPIVTVVDNCGSSTLTTNATGNLLWNTNETTPSITVTSGGNYTVTQSINGCISAAGSGSALPKVSPVAPVVTVVNNCGSSTLSTNAAGTLIWSTNENTPIITVYTVGNYSVTQTLNGCTSIAASVNASPLLPPVTPVVTVVNNCGSSTLSTDATGTLVWSTGETTPSITVNIAGSYTVTQTSNGCTSVAGSGIAAPNATPAAPVVTVVDNCGSSTLTTNATGTLLWSTNETTPSITVTSGGNYTVTQTINGCISAAGSGSASPKVSPAAPAVTVVNNCGGSTLSTNATGNLAWSNGGSTPSITVSNGNTYTVTQTVNGCTSVAGSGFAAPLPIPSTPLVTVANNCGSATLSTDATGILLWNTNESTPSITITNGGTYSVTQTVNGCISAAGSGFASPKVSPAAPIVSVIDNCGSSTLTTNATGTILWNTLETTASINVTSAGNYTVTQTVNGCTSAAGLGSASPKVLPAAPVVTVVNSCGTSTLSTNATGNLAWNIGGSTPSITVSNGNTYTVTQTVGGCTSAAGSGIAAPLTIPSAPTVTVANNCGNSILSTNATGILTWSNGNTTPSITVTNSGTYTVTQTAGGCTSAAGSGTSSPKAAVTAPVINVVNSCGSTTLSTNASGPYLWSNNATTSSINVTSGGNYSVTVSNTAGCSATSSASVTVNAIPVVAPITGTNSVIAGATTQLTDVTAGGVWTSSNTALATVNASGLVTGINAGSVTITYTVSAIGGCTTAVTTSVSVSSSCVAPMFTAINNINTNAVSGCSAPVSYTVAVTGNPALTYILTGATTGSNTGSGSGTLFNLGTTTVTIKALNACGSNTTSFTVTVVNANPLTATITPASADAYCNSLALTGTNGASSYKWISPSGSIYSTSAQINLGLLNADGNYQLYVSGANGCASSTAASYNYQKQNLINSYAILAFSEIQLGNNNTVNGGVGVTSRWGYVGLGSYTNISSAGSFVKAAYIGAWGWGINVANPIWGAATGITLPAMYYNTAGKADGNANYTVNSGVTTTLNGNYKNLTLKKGSNTILNGTIFGSITVEQGAQVTFSAASVNIDKLKMNKGPRYGYTYVRFSQNTKILVSTSVSISSNCFINPDNNKVTFYLGDSSPDQEKFTINGGDTKINANIYIPNGELKVTGGYRYGDYGKNGLDDSDSDDDDDKYYGQGTATLYMTGTFIADEVVGYGKNVIWTTFDCSAAPVAVISNSVQQSTTATAKENSVIATTTEEELKITVMPNPSTTYFTLRFESKYETPVNMRVMDASGRVVDAKSKIGSNSTIQIGANYASGTYYAEMIQGTQRKVVQLMKVK